VCGPEGIENGYEGVVDPDDECELFRGGRGDSILPRASLKASLCCCCCCVTFLGSCSGYLSVPCNLGGRDSEGLGFTSVGITNKSNYLGFQVVGVRDNVLRVRQTSKTFTQC